MCSKPEGTVSFYIQLCLQLPVLRGTFHSFNIKLTFTKQRLSIFALGTDTCDICFCLVCLQHVQIPHTHTQKKLCTACMWGCVIHWILKHDKQLNMHVIYFFVSKVLKPLWAWRKISWPWGTSSGKLWNFLNTIMCHFKHGAPTCCYWNQKYSNSLAPVGNKSLIGVCYFFNHSAPAMLLIL